MGREVSLTNEVRDYLMDVDLLGITGKHIEEHMNLSYTKLYRLLGKEGTTCKRLVVQEKQRRCSIAVTTNPSISVDELATICGYTNGHGISEAFRGWYGETFTQWRESHEQSKVL